SRTKSRVGNRSRRRLHEHALRRRRLEAGTRENLLSPPRLTRRLLAAGQRVRSDRHAQPDRDRHEREPAGDGGLPMRRTPTTCTRGKVVTTHEHLPGCDSSPATLLFGSDSSVADNRFCSDVAMPSHTEQHPPREVDAPCDPNTRTCPAPADPLPPDAWTSMERAPQMLVWLAGRGWAVTGS